MSLDQLTPAQRQAVQTVDRSVIVTAAAGSGKTTVLTERCAYLVCDAPAPFRCDVDELLVLTFTEAAAAQMKARILDAIRSRARLRPQDARLRSQAALVDTAQISTIHAFCLWMLRRWFHDAMLDPAAQVLDEDEAFLLRQDVLQALFADLYGEQLPLSAPFVRLIDEYGLGYDGYIADIVLRLSEFLCTLPDPQDWTRRAVAAVTSGRDATLAEFERQIRLEVGRQRDHVAHWVRTLQEYGSVCAFDREALAQYVRALEGWAKLEDPDRLREAITGFEFTKPKRPRLPDNAPDELRAHRKLGQKWFERARERLLQGTLQKYARFIREEAIDGLARTAPHVQTLLDLANAFTERYQASKRGGGWLDYADLERGAYDLLHDPADPSATTPVAEQLHKRFRHVLVDEYQDINPLQDAILRRVSHESVPGAPGNLFRVGDVKQSIYRFRLAEPELLQRAVEESRDAGSAATFALQENFRSLPSILEALNFFFERVMSRSTGGVDYDETARLRSGLSDHAALPRVPIEVHLLPRRPSPEAQFESPAPSDADQGPEGAEDETATVDIDDPIEWEIIRREAYVIGSRLRRLRSEGYAIDGRPMRWSDAVVLVRAAASTADRIAEQLQRMGVPATSETGGSMPNSIEIREVLALLAVLDNPRQDIPLASVLRSGIAGVRFNEDELVAIRLLDRALPFNQAAIEYSTSGPDAPLRQKLSDALENIERWRRDMTHKPLADVLWSVLLQSGYLAFVGGLPGGGRRRANLIALHERARQFGKFQRPGLHRFVRFLEAAADDDRPLRFAATQTGGDDAVRIMTIHRSKGLEFPIVFVANLGRQFHLTDARRRTILDRDVGLGLRVIDTERMIEYPSVQHMLANRSMEAASRQEEMRVLYVAMTRARQRLFLVGSCMQSAGSDASSAPPGIAALQPGPLTPFQLESANTPLDWLLPALAAGTPEQVEFVDEASAGSASGPLYRVYWHGEQEMENWRLEQAMPQADRDLRRAVAELAPLPPDEPRGDGLAAARVLDGVDFPYPNLAASSIRAVWAASEAKTPIDPFEAEVQATPIWRRPETESLPRPKLLDIAGHQMGLPPSQGRIKGGFSGAEVRTPAGLSPQLSPQQRGTLMHAVLQAIDFDADPGKEIERLVAAGVLNGAEAATLDVAALTWLLGTELAERIRVAGKDYRREFVFVAEEPAALFDPTIRAASTPGAGEETVLVRGIVDGVLADSRGLEVVDFKTDDVAQDKLEARVRDYTMQMRLYARAAAKLWQRPVSRGWLAFLTARRLVELPADELR